jgi:predicted ferric reductase
MGQRNIKGWLFIALVALMPIFLWLAFRPAMYTFSSKMEIIDILAKWCALAGISLLSLTIIFSARLKIFDRMFYGLDALYRVHHTIGCLTLLLLLSHSALLTIKYSLISLPAGFDFLVDTSQTYLLLGKISLAILICSLLFVTYVWINYQWFVRAMRIMGAVILLASLHSFFVAGSDIRRIFPLMLYMVLLEGTAIFVYLYRSIFHGSFSKRYNYEVISAEPKGDVTEVWLKPKGQGLRRYAGQFAFITFKNHVVKEQHPFTISAGSDDQKLRFCIKKSGDFTSTIPALKPGDSAVVEGPYGQFSFSKMKRKNQIWVAGGIGVTPFLSMARSLPKSGYTVDLYWSVKSADEAVFLNELHQAAKELQAFNVKLFVTDKQGYLTAEHIAKDSNVAKTDILLCGPPPMMHSLSDQFQKLGVDRANIHYEEFSL